MKSNQVKKIKKRLIRLGVISALCLVLPVVSLVIDPLLMMIKYKLRIAKGSLLWRAMQEEVHGAVVYSYLFNITNPDTFLSGEDRKLKLATVGPFTYQEVRKLEDQELDEGAQKLSYTPTNKPRFLREKSVADPRDINVTASNMILLAVASKISTLPFIAKASFNILMNQINSQPIITKPAYNLLWGYDEPLLSLGKTILPWMDIDSLVMLKWLYKENQSRLKMSISDADKFRIITVNNSSGIVERDYNNPRKRTRCNSYEDTYEGLGFQTKLKPGTPIRLYREIFCRILDLEYVGTETLDYGPTVLKYMIGNNAYSNTPQNDCLCQGRCLDGVTDISPCTFGLDFALSNGHFLHANSNIYDRIEGMHPNEEEHGSEFLIDSVTGMVLNTKFSIQVNVAVRDLGYNSHYKSFSDMVVPIAYFVVAQPELDEHFKLLYYLIHNVGPYVVHGVEAILIIIGAGILTLIGYTKFNEAFGKRTIAYHIPETFMEKTDDIRSKHKSDADYSQLHIIE